MIVSKSELTAVLSQYNPWWAGETFSDLPAWRRAAFREIVQWLHDPPGKRALLLSGARQVGKTTLFLQAIQHLLEQGIPGNNILYVTFDHPLLKLIGLDGLLRLWREIEPERDGPEYLFLDEIQATADWQTWVKHRVDFDKHKRIAVTGSATPLVTQQQESGVGRWQTLRLATLSFFEYMQIKDLPEPGLPQVASLTRLFDWGPAEFRQAGERSRSLIPYFHEYLLKGGFPQCALIDSVPRAQKNLREDIVDKVLKRDMTALFGVRRIIELEQTFLYVCLHDGGLLSLPDLCKNLQVKKPTALHFISLLEATHLIHRLMPFGYGKEILRGRPKIYLADAAIPGSVLLKGRSLLENPTALGQAVETAFFKHVFTRYYRENIAFSYWHDARRNEVDIVAQVEGRTVPFEVKYRSSNLSTKDVKGLLGFCRERKVPQGYVITRETSDFGLLQHNRDQHTRILKIPAHLACYWLGRLEVEAVSDEEKTGGEMGPYSLPYQEPSNP